MEEAKYRNALRTVLDAHSERTKQQLSSLLKVLPEGACSLELGIHPDQDGEGQFSIYAALTGPGLTVLNKAIEDRASIFDVVHTTNGFDPAVPMLDPEDTDYEVQDVIFECTAQWLAALWSELNLVAAVPVSVVNRDEFSEAKPRVLQR